MSQTLDEWRITAAINAEMNPEDAHAILAQAVIELRASLRAATERAEAALEILGDVETVAAQTLIELYHEPDSLPMRRARGFLGDIQRIAENARAARSGSPNEGTV